MATAPGAASRPAGDRTPPAVSPPVLHVLGVPVDAELFAAWRGFYAPGRQPFRLDDLPVPVAERLAPARAQPVSDELRDTFFVYRGGRWAWLSEHEFRALDAGTRRLLAAERRARVRPKPVPVWPSDPLLDAHLVRWVEAGGRASLHALAAVELAASASVLPRAAELAGTFPRASGGNCFATVMAASGLPVADDWIQTERFAAWLSSSTRPVGGPGFDADAGTVLVWREHGELAHAAVTLGGGWLLQKRSQSWSSPREVCGVEEQVRSWRYPHTGLERHRLRSAWG